MPKIHGEVFNPSVNLQGTDLRLTAKVNDDRVREKITPNADGFEKVFALIPGRDWDTGELKWTRHDLGFDGKSYDRFGPPSDNHSASLSIFDVDLAAVARLGVAFGAEITDGQGNKQTVWLQTRDDNFGVKKNPW